MNNPKIGVAERFAVDRVLISGKLAQGERVSRFEDAFSRLVEGRACVAVNSGTSALHLGALALGLGPGDEVIVPSFTFAATANAIAVTGATPVFVDIDLDTYCLDPSAVESAITPRTRAIVAVHLYGQPANLLALSQICTERGLALIEDAAQAHLAQFEGRPVGTWGEIKAFSFYPTKNMTSGEGGMLVAADPQLERSARLLRNQGMIVRYQNEVPGFNNRMTEISAAIGIEQLKKIENWKLKRRMNAQFFLENMKGVVVPAVVPGTEHVYHQFTIRTPGHEREAFARELRKFGVSCDVYYPIPVHRFPAYKLTHDLPKTEEACASVLSKQVHQSLSTAKLHHITAAVNSISSAGA